MTTEKTKKIQINPLEITESLGYTTFRRYSRKPWTKEEDSQLTELVNTKLISLGYADGIQSLHKNTWLVNSIQIPQDIDWDDIGEKLETRKPKDCRKRWANSLDPTLKKGKWTTEEDDNLIKTFQKIGPSWQKISLEIPGRTDDQCAKRYIEVLDPNTKDRLRPWSLEEDLSLIKKVKSYGTKWRTISMEMQSRPSLTCRNRWRKIVTDVVRGKACDEIRSELDSIKEGFSKIEEISENLQTLQQQRDEKKAEAAEEEPDAKRQKTASATTTAEQQQQLQQQQQHQSSSSSSSSGKQTDSNGNTSAFNTNLQSRNPPPTSTSIDWKYTLKDHAGLSLSSGSISTTELAKEIISQAKKLNLKISIHQHIHHHYSTGFNMAGSKGTSPADSTPGQNNGNGSNHDGTEAPNRYSHFNYLPPMVQPHLGSSSVQRDHDISKLLNHSTPPNHSNNNNNATTANSNNTPTQQQQQRKASHGSSSKDALDDEGLDFWETMRSLSRVVNPQSGTAVAAAGAASSSSSGAAQMGQRLTGNGLKKANDYELFYSAFGDGQGDDEFDEDALDDLEEDIRGLTGILPFNPS